MKALFSILLIGTLSTSYSQWGGKEYTLPGVDTIVSKHKIFAILPFIYKVQLKKIPKGVTVDSVRKREIASSLACQDSLYKFLCEKKEEGKIKVEIQAITKTNALLKKNDVHEDNFDNYLPEQYCKILEVDAVIIGHIVASHPMSTGAAIGSELLISFDIRNHAKIYVKLYGIDGTMIWSYSKDIYASVVGSDENELVSTLLRKSARRLPYGEVK